MAVWKRCRPTCLEHTGPALFLDRDGVVVVEKDYLSDPEEVELVPGSAQAMKCAAEAGYILIGVSNQSGLGRSRFFPEDFSRVMDRLEELLAEQGTGFDGFYYCPHAPRDGCVCRKPAPGLLEEAWKSCRWDPQRSWVVGDKASDVAFGRDHGLGAVLVRTGYGPGEQDLVNRLWQDDPLVLVADDLRAAVAAIRSADTEKPEKGPQP